MSHCLVVKSRLVNAKNSKTKSARVVVNYHSGLLYLKNNTTHVATCQGIFLTMKKKRSPLTPETEGRVENITVTQGASQTPMLGVPYVRVAQVAQDVNASAS